MRAKAKIRDANIPYEVPGREALPARLDSVLRVIYLVFNEGYLASSGESATRADLSGEAIRLGRLVVELCPEPEARGLLALMLLHESRREARADEAGELILLDQQDRTRWNRALIEEGASAWYATHSLRNASVPMRCRRRSPPYTPRRRRRKTPTGGKSSGCTTCCWR